jgi:hypothetical protein
LEVVRALTTGRIAHDVAELRRQFEGVPSADLEAMARRLHDVRQTDKSLHQIASRTRTKVADIGAELERLVHVGVVIRGFKVECGLCGVDSFVELAAAQRQPACPGCGSSAAFEATSGREPMLRYRLNAMVDRASDNGVLNHIIAVAALHDHAQNREVYIAPGVNLLFPTGRRAEADLLGLIGGDVWYGEAKSSAGWFTEEQIDGDLDSATGVGASHYLAVCPGGLGSDVEELILAKAQSRGVAAAVLTAPEGSIRFVTG